MCVPRSKHIYKVRPKSRKTYIFSAPIVVVIHLDLLDYIWKILAFTAHIKVKSVPSIVCLRITDLVHSCFEIASRRTMENTFEQRWAIEFCTKLDKTVTELLKKPYGKCAPSYVQVTRWVKKEDQEGVDDNPPTSALNEWSWNEWFGQRCLLRGCSGKIEEKDYSRTKIYRRCPSAASRQCPRLQESACPWLFSHAQCYCSYLAVPT